MIFTRWSLDASIRIAGPLSKTSRPNRTPSSPVIPAPAALELVEDAIVFVERAQLTPEVFVHLWRNKQEAREVGKGNEV